MTANNIKAYQSIIPKYPNTPKTAKKQQKHKTNEKLIQKIDYQSRLQIHKRSVGNCRTEQPQNHKNALRPGKERGRNPLANHYRHVWRTHSHLFRKHLKNIHKKRDLIMHSEIREHPLQIVSQYSYDLYLCVLQVWHLEFPQQFPAKNPQGNRSHDRHQLQV